MNDDRFRERVFDANAWGATAIQLLEAAQQLEPTVREFWEHPASLRPWSAS